MGVEINNAPARVGLRVDVSTQPTCFAPENASSLSQSQATTDENFIDRTDATPGMVIQQVVTG